MSDTADITAHPEAHQHRSIDELVACCLTKTGALNVARVDAHERIAVKRSAGRGCDAQSGPCSCGAWH